MPRKKHERQAFRGPIVQFKRKIFMKKYNFSSQDIKDAWSHVTNAKSIALFAHLRPDPDSLGACIALADIFTAAGKHIEIVYPESTADPFPLEHDYTLTTKLTQKPDLIICCDIASDARAYTDASLSTVPRIIIDHHLNNTMGGILRFVAPQASSTCEIIFDLVTAWQQTISARVANYLLFGILCDTLNFQTQNTTAHTLQIAGSLIAHGADLATLNQKMILHKNPQVLMLWGELLSHIQHTPDNNAVWATCTQQMLRTHQCDETALVGFIGMLSRTITSEVTILFLELPDGTSKASLRGKTTDVRAIATQLGGGGHKLAAGVSLAQPLSELMKAVLEKLA